MEIAEYYNMMSNKKAQLHKKLGSDILDFDF